MAPKTREGSRMRLYRKTTGWHHIAEMIVKDLFKGRGTITDDVSEKGDRIYCTDSKYPGYEFTIRTWSFRSLKVNSDETVDMILDSYTIYAEKIKASEEE